MPKQQAFSFARNPFHGVSVDDLSDDEARQVVALALAVLERQHRPGQAITHPDMVQAICV